MQSDFLNFWLNVNQRSAGTFPKDHPTGQIIFENPRKDLEHDNFPVRFRSFSKIIFPAGRSAGKFLPISDENILGVLFLGSARASNFPITRNKNF